MSSADCFLFSFSKHSSRNMIRVSINLGPDQDRQNVGPDMGPNCFQRLSIDDKIRHWRKGQCAYAVKELSLNTNHEWQKNCHFTPIRSGYFLF